VDTELRGQVEPERTPPRPRVAAALPPGPAAPANGRRPAVATSTRADIARAEWVRNTRPEPALLEQHAVLEDPALRAERVLLGEHPLIEDRACPAERPPAGFVLGGAGGAAALTLGGVLFLALPGAYTALTVLLIGVIAWTGVVLLSFRLQSRRQGGSSADRSSAVERRYQRRVRAARSPAPESQ